MLKRYVSGLRDGHAAVRLSGPQSSADQRMLPFVLPNSRASVIFCTMRVQSPGGEQIEGIGVVPDHPVKWTVEDPIEGRDPDLGKALEVLGRDR